MPHQISQLKELSCKKSKKDTDVRSKWDWLFT